MRLKGRVVRIPGVSRVSRPPKGVENFGNIDRRMSKGEKVLRSAEIQRLYRSSGMADSRNWPAKLRFIDANFMPRNGGNRL